MGLVFLLFLLSPAVSLAGTFTAFGPQDFLRGTGAPVTETRSFTVRNPTTTYTLRIFNGGLKGDLGRVSSAVIRVNGRAVVGPQEFNQNVGLIERQISLLTANLLAVELRGGSESRSEADSDRDRGTDRREPEDDGDRERSTPKRRSGITIEIIGVDNDRPLITASLSPPANAAGWNNTDVRVSFTCADATSGIARCPGPIAELTVVAQNGTSPACPSRSTSTRVAPR